MRIEEIADVLIHQVGFFLLDPMARIRNVFDLEWASEQALHPVSQFLAECEILLAQMRSVGAEILRSIHEFVPGRAMKPVRKFAR
jgi:hypothetical protein